MKDGNVGRCKGKGREGGWNVSMGNGNVRMGMWFWMWRMRNRVDIVLPVV